MSLKKYVEKRKFNQTPEPGPGEQTPVPSSKLQFCVQRHHASHLHYDLRLEVDGALKSWAVPKGPTLDPEVKRLAMMVEDHPMDYGGFEGVIPKGNYGAGSVMLWDRGTYELLGDATADQQLTRGDFKFRLAGQKLLGEFAIVRIKSGKGPNKGNEWLLIKKKDAAARPGWDPEDHAESVLTGRTQEEIARELAPKQSKSPEGFSIPKSARKAPMPKLIPPMLATLGKGKPPVEDGWVYEIKWDGVRALCFLDAGKLRILSRKGESIDKQYPELSVLPHHIRAQQAIIDGEIAALDAQGRPSFELLQHRINVVEPSAIARLSRAHPVVFYAFDLLYLDGHDLRSVPLIERKKLLETVLEPGDVVPGSVVRYSDHFDSDGNELLEAARQQSLEGIVGKRASSHYVSSRSADWVKWKVSNSSDFVICGFTPGEREGLGALVLGMNDQDKLKWAGNVGTGFDAAMVRTLLTKLEPLITAKSPFGHQPGLPKKVTWTKPELVCEVKFAHWTEEGRLRAPVFLGLRNDIDPPRAARAVLLDPTVKETMVTVDGHRLKLTNLDKIFYPRDGYRKRDLLNYYDAVAPLLVPHLKDRPLSLKRYPNGIDKPFFFQKQIAESFPKWLHTSVADEIEYVIGDGRATLLYLVNLGCIDHNPWMSRVGSLEHPDYLLIDLDPHECGYERIVEAALWARGWLDKIGLESYPKTTGGDGMHIFVPLEPVYTYEQVRTFAQGLAALGAAERPDLFTTPRTVSKRDKGKVYFDWQQIAEGKTISAPYVVRAYAGAPVATPLAWSEVTARLRPEQFHLGNAIERFDRVGDLFEGVLKRPQRLEKAINSFAGG